MAVIRVYDKSLDKNVADCHTALSAAVLLSVYGENGRAFVGRQCIWYGDVSELEEFNISYDAIADELQSRIRNCMAAGIIKHGVIY